MTRADAHRARRDDDRATRRNQLLDDAVEAIRELGPGATMEQLARRGGVTKPILYRHFRDRDGLLTAIAERFGTDLLAAIEATLLVDAGNRELLESTIDGYLGYIEREPALYRFLVRHASSQDDGLPSISPLIDHVARQVAVVVGERLRAAGLDSGAAVPWAYGIVGMVHQAGDWWLEDQTMPRERLVQYLT